MVGLDVLATVEVGDGAGNFQDAVVGTSREAELVHGGFQNVAARLVKFAVFLDKLRSHLRVGVDGREIRVAFFLYLSRFDDALAHLRTRLAAAL